MDLRAHVKPGFWACFNKAAVFELSLERGGHADTVLFAGAPNGCNPVAGAQRAALNELLNLAGDLFVERGVARRFRHERA